jgi:hypothetical protein
VLSLRSLRQLEKFVEKKLKAPPAMATFFSMIDRRKSLHRRITESPPKIRSRLLESGIPYSSLIEQMAVHRAPLPTFARRSAPGQAFQDLWDEVSSLITL